MKRLPLIIILSILLIAGFVYAKGVYYYGTQTVSGGSAMNGTLLEDWSGGSANGEDDNDQLVVWTANAVHDATNWDDSNTTNSIGGVEDLLLGATDADQAYAAHNLGSGQAQIAVAFEMSLDATNAVTYYFGLTLDHATGPATSAPMFLRWIWDAGNSDYNLRAYYNSGVANADANPDCAYTPNVATVRYVCVKYVPETVAENDGVLQVYWATTKPTSTEGWGSAVINISTHTDADLIQYVGLFTVDMLGHVGQVIYTIDGTLPYWGS